MKLANVLMAQSAWKRLAGLKMPPAKAYMLLKYAKLVTAELEVIEQQRVKLIHEITGTKEGENISLAPGTPEHAQFVAAYTVALDVDSDLKQCDMKMDELLSTLTTEEGNALSVEDLGNLEPFFLE